MKFETFNEQIATEPFKTDAVEKVANKGFATVKQKTSLTALKVVFGTPAIPSGSTVYVRGDFCVEPAAKQFFDVEGQVVIFIPVREVKLVKRDE